ncbi:MAG: sigma-70 family RNA polymerase sigma factor [Myxococcota bacterium]
MSQPSGPSPRLAVPRPSRDELASIHAQLIRSFARRAHPDAAVAPEDVVQTAWIRFLERLDEFEGRSSLSTFAFGIAANVQRELWGRAVRRQRLMHANGHVLADHERPEHEQALDRERARARLYQALSVLDGRERWLVEQRLVEDLPYDQILPEFQRRFPNQVSTVEGLRSAFFRARGRLVAGVARAPAPAAQVGAGLAPAPASARRASPERRP